MREGLHELRGRIEVALDLIDRSADLCARTAGQEHLLQELELAARALAAAAGEIDQHLCRTVLSA